MVLPTSISFQTKKGPTVSGSNIRSIAFYGCLEILRTRNFTIFTVYATSFGQFSAAFHFSNYIGGIDHFTLTFRKGPILTAGPSEEFLIVDHPKEEHNKREFKRLIIGGILDQLEKS